MSDSEGRFMVGVAAVIEHKATGEILILKRSSKADSSPSCWEICSGRLKQFEAPEDGLRREVIEETGLKIRPIKPIRAFHFFRGKRTAKYELVGITYMSSTMSRKVRLSEEHSDFRWVLPGEALKTINIEGIKQDIRAFLKEKCSLSVQNKIYQRKR